MKEKNIQETILNFEKKLKRFLEGTNPKIQEKPKPQNLTELIKEQEQIEQKKIIETYKKFLNPLQILGKDSAIAQQIEKDKENLFLSFQVFEKISQINTELENTGTKITQYRLESPLTTRERYTQGNDFIYLQFWFLKEKNPDFIPVFEDISETKKQITFVQYKDFHHRGKEREIFILLQNTFE